eukprot:1161369-Pelagomonas_calceolata.AAC.2
MQAAAYHCRDAGAQYVLLGSGSQAGALRQAAETDFRNHPDIRRKNKFSERSRPLEFQSGYLRSTQQRCNNCALGMRQVTDTDQETLRCPLSHDLHVSGGISISRSASGQAWWGNPKPCWQSAPEAWHMKQAQQGRQAELCNM